MIWSTIVTPLLVSTAQHMKEMHGGPRTCGCDGEIPRLVQVPAQALERNWVGLLRWTHPRRLIHLRSSIRFCLKIDLDRHNLRLQRSRKGTRLKLSPGSLGRVRVIKYHHCDRRNLGAAHRTLYSALAYNWQARPKF